MKHVATRLLATTAAALVIAAPIQAQTSVSPNLGTTVPGSFTTDRYTPPVFDLLPTFQGRSDVLEIGTNSSADAANRPNGQGATFYNTQGEKTTVNTSGSWTFSSDLWVSGAMLNADRGFVRTDIWATATDDPSFSNPSAYPIIGFTNFGGAARFRGYDVNTGAWIDFAAPPVADTWATLTMSFDQSTNSFSYLLNGTFQAAIVADDAQTGVANVMYQVYNFNDPSLLTSRENPAYNVQYAETATTATPEPASIALMATGLFGVAGVVRRRKRAQ